MFLLTVLLTETSSSCLETLPPLRILQLSPFALFHNQPCNAALSTPQVQDKYSAFAGSPINGRMFVHGSIRGSAEEPQGDIAVRLFNGAIGPTRLAEAAVHIQVDAEQFVCFNLNMQPEDAPGYVKVRLPCLPMDEFFSSLPIGAGRTGVCQRRASGQ